MNAPQLPHWLLGCAALGAALGMATCADGGGTQGDPAAAPLGEARAGVSLATPVGLALEVDNGAGVPLKLRAGQTFYINQIDLRASRAASVDEGVSGLAQQGDFASLAWSGVALEEEGPPLANGNGTFTRRRFYRGAKWMREESSLSVVPVDAAGSPLAPPVTVNAGADAKRSPDDSFFIRRLRAIQWTRDCASETSCAGATQFEEEALVELRNATTQRTLFTLPAAAAALRVSWSERPGAPWTIPVTQVESPTWDHGFSIDVAALTPPGPGGYYAPGQDVTFQLTLRDGSGQRLHPAGSLPTYNEVVFGPNEAGIRYYRAFFDASATYWRRKHRETMLMAQIIGPAQDIQPIRSVIGIEEFLGEEDVQTTGTIERDGVFSQCALFPPANDLFGGAFDPTHAGWAAPVSDTWTFHLPEDAPPGSYIVTVKGRRVYMGEDIPATTNITIQVGSVVPTEAALSTGPCNTCHSGGGELSTVLHANDNRAACAGCHAPLSFELEGPIVVRSHFIHSRSNRVEQHEIKRCANCHLTPESVQRTSKAACLSCHTSYPESHVAAFGPVHDIYIGGGAESFGACAGSCHASHPGSGL